jgi:hypothetical protein
LQPVARRKICHLVSSTPFASAICSSRSRGSSLLAIPSRKYATNIAPSRLPIRTKPRFGNRSRTVMRPLKAASGSSAMSPVSSSAPPITTKITPRLKTVPAKNVGRVPHSSTRMPAVVTVANSAPNTM